MRSSRPVLMPRVGGLRLHLGFFLYSPMLGLINYLVGLTGPVPSHFLPNRPWLSHVSGQRRYLAMGGLFFTVII